MPVFGFKEWPSPFFSNQRPRRGCHVLAPLDSSDKVSCTVSQIQFRKFRKSYLSKFCKALQGSSIQLLQCFAGTKVVNFCTVLQWMAKHCLLMLENWNIRVHPSQDITFKKKKFKMHTSWGLQLQKSKLNAREYQLESLDTEQREKCDS